LTRNAKKIKKPNDANFSKPQKKKSDLFMKEASLESSRGGDSPNRDASDHVLGLFWKALSRRRGAWAWFHGVWTCIAKSS